MASPGYHFTSSMGLDDWCSKPRAATKAHSPSSTPYGSVEGMIGDRGANDLADLGKFQRHSHLSRRSTESRTSVDAEGILLGVTVGVAEDQGFGRLLKGGKCSAETAMYVGVFDGHLTSRSAEIAAARLHEILAEDPDLVAILGHSQERLQDKGVRREISRCLQRGFQRCDDEILRASLMEGSWRGGTTALIALLLDQELFVAHVGDSGALVLRDGKPRRLTKDHKPSVPAEAARIQAAGGIVDEMQDTVGNATHQAAPTTMLAMSRALGDIDFKGTGPGTRGSLISALPDVRHLHLGAADSAVLLASDGLFEVMTDHAIAEILHDAIEGQPPTEATATRAARELVEVALDEGSLDNISVLVLLPAWAAAPMAESPRALLGIPFPFTRHR